MTTQQKYWTAVLNRDISFDGRFVYAVRSTRIYCRPSCPSRRPGREQVIFFAAATAAEQAGFRPCRRCEPAVQEGKHDRLIREVCRYLEQHSAGSVRISDLSRKFATSASHLNRIFKRAVGVSMTRYARTCRMRAFKTSVRNGSDITTAIYDAGFGSSSRVYEQSAAALGMTPGEYRRGGNGTEISYTTATCSLGRLLVATTNRGICSVTLGKDDAEVVSALRAEYPQAQIQRAGRTLQKSMDHLLALLSGSEPGPDLPLDIRATAFQRRVWEELRRIPYGTSLSYSEIASRIGNPKSTRAVARACAANPVAVLIPCHRVVAKSGKAGGYRWGKKRKQQLLESEKKAGES
jgi:AraC family transcriptional regulator, regulatory protein of adaptative response / methylated-DNA-[protein]-cysteine methyltransferase